MSDARPLRARSIRAARSNLVTTPVLAVLSIAGGVAIARTLGPAAFAVYAIAVAVRETAQFLSDLGTSAASQRLFAQLEELGTGHAARRLYGGLLLLRVALAAAAVLVLVVAPAALARLLVLGGEREVVLAAVVLLAVAEVFSSPAVAALNGMLRQGEINRANLARGFMQPLGVIAVSVLGGGIAGVMLVMLLVSAARTVALHAFAIRALRRLPAGRGRTPPGLRRSFARTSATAGLGRLAAWVHTRSALSVLVAAATTKPSFAAFALGYDLSVQAISSVSAPAGPVSAAVLAKRATHREQQRRAARSIIRILTAVCAGLAVGVVVVGPGIVGPVYGPQFGAAGTYLAILMPALVLETAIGAPIAKVMLSDDRLLRPYLLTRLVPVALLPLYLVVGVGDVLGVIVVMAAVRAVSVVVLMVVAQRCTGRTLTPRASGRLLAVAAVAAAVGIAVRAALPAGAWGGLLAGAVALAGYLVGVRVVRGLTAGDVALVRGIVSRPR